MSSSEEEEFELGNDNEEEEEADEEGDDNDEEEDDEEEDDNPRTRKRKSAVSYAEDDEDEEEDDDDDDDDSDDDDIPLAQLKSPKKKAKPEPKKKVEKKAVATAAPKKKAASSKKSSKSAETTAATTASSSRSLDEYDSLAGAIFGSDCVKGQLIQKLLCRWWYAIDWPTNLPPKPPKNYDAMNGMPGVYVCTAGDEVGKIMDVRDAAQRPCFANFLKMDSEELKKLLMTAVQEQKRQLIEAEGEGTPTEKELKDMLKWVQKVNGDKADKDAGRVLKKAGMPQ